MKYLKSFNESVFSDVSKFIKNKFTKSKTKDKYDFIKGSYTVNEDGSIDVVGSVDLTGRKLNKLPIKFGKVSGDFNCISNELTSLENSPCEVGGNFYCDYNNLTSLHGSPIKIGQNFICRCNELTSLDGCCEKIGGNFNCSQNKLTSLNYGPTVVGGYYSCSNNKLMDLVGSPEIVNEEFYTQNNLLTSLEGCPGHINGSFDCFDNCLFNLNHCGNVSGELYLDKNPVYEIFKLCPTMEFINYLNEFTPIRGKKPGSKLRSLLGKRLQECLYMCDVEIDVTTLTFEKYTLEE